MVTQAVAVSPGVAFAAACLLRQGFGWVFLPRCWVVSKLNLDDCEVRRVWDQSHTDVF